MSADRVLEILKIGENKSTEFKKRLTRADLKPDRIQKLVTRIRYMTCEDPFEGRFLVGIEDVRGSQWRIDGLSEEGIELAEEVLSEICKEAGVDIVEKDRVETAKGVVGVYLLKRIPSPEIKETCSINIAGRVSSGKSTLVGCLVTGSVDDGSGKARSFLLKHPQEITRGQTADIHLAFMGFTHDGRAVHLQNPLDKEEAGRALDQSARIVTFFDAPGHMEHSKTMIRSILGGDAAYGLVLVPIPDEARLIQSEQIDGGRMRLDDITREHLILMSSRDAPFMVILSKADKASPGDLTLVDDLVRETLKEIGKIPVNVRSVDEISPVVKEIGNGVIVPVLQVAATDMSSMKLLIELLRQLPVDARSGDPSGPARAYVDKVYRGIRGTNVVVTGTVMSGVFKTGQTVVIGPGQNGEMAEGRLFSIEMFNKRVIAAKSGDPFGFDIKDVDKHQVRRGQTVTDPGGSIGSCRVFEANIVVTRHPTRISEGYAPVLQCHTIQQTVILRTIYGLEFLCVGDFARVRLEFMMGSEALQVGDRIVLREANTRAIGTIAEIVS